MCSEAFQREYYSVASARTQPFPSPPSLPLARREERGAVDCPGGDPVPPLLLGLGRLELRHCDVGGHVLWRETLLGHGQPGCKCYVCVEEREREIGVPFLLISAVLSFHIPSPAPHLLPPPSVSEPAAWILLKGAPAPLKAFAGPKPPPFLSLH